MDNSQPWVRKHAPKRVADLVGHEEAARQALRHVRDYAPGGKPLILAGPPGIGKTSLVYAIAEELDRELLEVNASDARNKVVIEEVIGSASRQQSLFLRERVILLDEIDGLSGRADRGGVQALAKLIEGSRHPIICTANDADDDKLKALRKLSVTIDLAPPSPEQVASRLREIADEEKVEIGEAELKTLARRCAGDMRAAITDLQMLAGDGKVTKEEVDLISAREQKDAIEQALVRVFKTTSAELALPAFDAVDMQPGDVLSWVEENLPKVYAKPRDLARAMEEIALADRYLGRIRRWQYYRYYVYIYNFLSAGVALAKDEKYAGQIAIKRPSRGLSVWIYRRKNAKREQLASELAPQLHTSVRRVRSDVLPYLKVVYKNSSKEKRKRLLERYRISDDEWLKK